MELFATLTPHCGPDPSTAVAHPPPGVVAVEVRLDLFPDSLDLEMLVSASPVPILATLRSTAEGGRGSTDPDVRRARLARARDAGAALLDLELERDVALFGELGLPPEQVVLSWHDTAGTPEGLGAVVAAMQAHPARWWKVVPTTTGLEDLVRVLSVGGFLPRAADRRRLIAFGMGPAGVPSRYLAPLLGAPIMYVAWNLGSAAAPGQLTAEALLGAVGHLDAPPQRLLGVVGTDTTRSLSPQLHGAAYRALGLPWALVPISATRDELALLFQPAGETVLDRLGRPVAGWAVTSPFKREAARAATLAAPRVRRAGAANTLVLKPGRILAENTDADGVVAPLLSRDVALEGSTALVHGTGGAARGAVVGLSAAGARVVVRGRDPAMTRALATELGVESARPGAAAGAGWVLVNATPVGLEAGDPSPFSPEEVGEAAAVVDMVYREGTTELVELAMTAGVPVVDGREMLVAQGVAQIAALTGRVPPREPMAVAVSRRAG